MNKRILILILCIIIGLVVSTLVLADAEVKEISKLNSDVINVNDTYVKLEEQNFNTKNYIQKSNECLNKLKIKNETFENPIVEIYRNNMENREEVVISDSDKKITVDRNTGELISFSYKKAVFFKKNTLSKDDVEKVAIELFNSFDNFENYELYSVQEFDEELYIAKFCKKYGNYMNIGEMISFGFSPEEREIVDFAKKTTPYANNELKLSEEARKKVMLFLDKDNLENITIELKIVRPNSGLKPVLEGEFVYKENTETRLAYVCILKDNGRTKKIYIDATTRKIIGADWMIGGCQLMKQNNVKTKK